MKIISTLALIFCATVAQAHETDRESQLKATNDELTTRVAELLKENKRLETSLREVLIAKSNNQRIVEGCDTQALRKNLVSGDGDPSIAQSWLDGYGDKCSKEQLKYLSKNLRSWSGWNMGDPIRYVDYLIDSHAK